MPYTITGAQSSSEIEWSKKESYDYDYPGDLDFRPGSKLHIKIRDEVRRRATDSRAVMTQRFKSWNEIDRFLTTYVSLTDKEKSLQKKDYTKPVTVIFPYSYATMESLLTYLSLAFFQDPLIRYEGFGPEDIIGSTLLELTVKLHCIKNKVPLAIHTVLRDSLAYGIGIGVPTWEVKRGYRALKVNEQMMNQFSEEELRQNQFIEDIIFEGNSLETVDPYMFLPDPMVSAHEVQKGEFVGWIQKDNYPNLLSAEREIDSGLFNVKYLSSVKNKLSTLALDQSQRKQKYSGRSTLSTEPSASSNVVDKLFMYINLIPKEWKLGTSEYPEKWLFCLASDEVIIRAEKLTHIHGMYPVAVSAPEFDGYTSTPISKLETLAGLQGVLDFLFNSHITNVRKAINDMIVVDPSIINIDDLKDPQPGKIIRARKGAFNSDIKQSIFQLNIADITQNHIADSAYITQWMDKISGADQSMMGAQRSGGPERLTKGEFQGTRGSAISRLQRMAMIISMQLMQDTGDMFASHTQQYMERDLYVKVLGEYMQKVPSQQGRALVTPDLLSINYDTIVRDGSIPGGNFSDAWMQMFSIIGGSDILIQEFDIGRIFSYIATQLGAKNVDDFRRNVNQTQTSVMPNEQIEQQVQAGNIVPTGEI